MTGHVYALPEHAERLQYLLDRVFGPGEVEVRPYDPSPPVSLEPTDLPPPSYGPKLRGKAQWKREQR